MVEYCLKPLYSGVLKGYKKHRLAIIYIILRIGYVKKNCWNFSGF